MTIKAEGWTWLHNASKWYYFVNGRSLCKRWMLFGNPELEYNLARRKLFRWWLEETDLVNQKEELALFWAILAVQEER